MIIEEKHYYPGDIIYSKHEANKNDCCLVYICKGNVELLLDQNNIEE
jgi:hypothetical protein